jgi:mono/diheme cytochrome c family protein
MSNPNGVLARLRSTLFGDSGRAFGTMSVVLLVLLAIAPAKNHFSEWRHYQKKYVKFVSTRAEGATLQKHFEPGVQQIWIPEQQVTDRCTTCHTGLKEASLTDVAMQPFRKHPNIPHSLTEFGCTTCHRGQGTATTAEDAHNANEAWDQPLLPAKYIEAGCGQCHLNALAGTPQLNTGRKLLAAEGCVHCHVVKQADATRLTATDDPPSLIHVADKTSREWMFAWIKNPQAYSTTATMPNFLLSDDDARDISSFLVAQSTPLLTNDKPTAAVKTAAAADPTAGATLYGQSFCASCHAVTLPNGNIVGGDLGPELTKIGTKAKPAWIEAWLRNPAAYDSNTRMPHYRFDDKQIATLSGFLQAKADLDFLSNVHLADSTPAQIAHGKQLVSEYGCASCHEINGVKKPENFAPELTKVGSKPTSQILFIAGMKHTLPDYISGKIKNPRVFSPGLKMPQYALKPQQIDALTTALLAQTERAQTQSATLRVASARSSAYQPAGKAGHLISDLRCFSCHAFNGRGGDMAPDLSWEGSAVQRAWLTEFLKNPNTLRPALIRRMPKFNLTPDEINTLSDYMLTVYQSPAIDRDAMSESEFTATQRDVGRQLFYGKYSCNSCHIVDASKDKGYIGPALWEVGSRLTPSWIYQYLKNPQAVRPGTIEPNQQMTDADAKALTAYLTSLKSKGKQVAKK